MHTYGFPLSPWMSRSLHLHVAFSRNPELMQCGQNLWLWLHQVFLHISRWKLRVFTEWKTQVQREEGQVTHVGAHTVRPHNRTNHVHQQFHAEHRTCRVHTKPFCRSFPLLTRMKRAFWKWLSVDSAHDHRDRKDMCHTWGSHCSVSQDWLSSL